MRAQKAADKKEQMSDFKFWTANKKAESAARKAPAVEHQLNKCIWQLCNVENGPFYGWDKCERGFSLSFPLLKSSLWDIDTQKELRDKGVAELDVFYVAGQIPGRNKYHNLFNKTLHIYTHCRFFQFQNSHSLSKEMFAETPLNS